MNNELLSPGTRREKLSKAINHSKIVVSCVRVPGSVN